MTAPTPSKRPPLGPHAKRNLTVFAVLTALKTLALIVFAAVLGTAITLLARMTYAVLYEGKTYESAHAEQLAIFAGNGQAQLTGIFFATPFMQPGLLSLAVTGVIALLVRAAADWSLSFYAQQAATGAKTTIRRKLIRRVLATGGIDTPDGTGATAVLLSRGLNALDDYYTKTLTAFVSTAVVPTLLLVFIAFYDWVSALVILCTLPLIPLFMVLIGRTTAEDTARAQRDLLRLSDHIVELVKGLPVLVGLGRSRAQSKALGDLGERYRKATMYTLRSAFLSSLALELITTISVALVAVLIGLRLVEGNLGLDVALFALLLAPECYQPLRDVGTAYHQSEDGVAALRRAEDIINQPIPHATVAPGGDRISVRQLSVAYPNRDRTLTGVSFTLRHGTTTAITGPSGCGKTTLLSVLGGALRNDLVPTGTTEPVHVSGLVSGTGSTVWISQSPTFIAPTALAEVALYATVTRGEGALEGINYASTLLDDSVAFTDEDRDYFTSFLHSVGLADLADLPPEALSAGQMRRLAIARALARVATLQAQNERVTVLIDEPTAHLDPVSAAKVNVALAALQETGATLIIVTHDTALAAATNNLLQATPKPHGITWELTAQNTDGLGGYALATLADAVATGELEDSAPVQAAAATPYQSPEPAAAGVLTTLRHLGELTGIRKRDMALPILLSVLTVVFAVSLTALSGWLIVRAAEQPAMMYLLVAVTGVRFFGLGRATSRYAERLRTHDLVLGAANTLRVRAWDAAGRTVLSVRSLLRGDKILDRLVGDIDELRDAIPRVILPLASHLIVMLLVLGVTAWATPQALLPVAVAALVATFLIPLIVLRADERADAVARRETSAMLRLGVSALDAATDLHNNGLDQTVALAVSRQDGYAQASRLKSSRAIGVGQGLMVVTWWGAALAVVASVWPAVEAGTVTAPTAAIVILMMTGLFESTAAHLDAVRGWPAFAALVARTRANFETVDAAAAVEGQDAGKGEIRDILGDPGIGAKNRTAHKSITLELDSLATRWPDMDYPVFSELSASVSSGQWLGITGPSGSGKTTALATLLGFLPVEQGQIRVNGRAFDAQSLRGYAAWCPQSAYIFESTIANNLAIARSADERPTDEEMYEVLDRVGLGDFVRSLPAGLQTLVGAGGSYVSGGQRQRIAIARTLLVDSPLLLMDEPTAHLDAPAAVALINEVARGTKRAPGQKVKGKTKLPAVVLVSHRAEDIAACDTVVKLR